MEININVQEITKKLSDRLMPTGWQQLLSNFLSGPEMRYIIEQLVDIKKDDEYFVPAIRDVFRFLEMCPVYKVRVLLLIDVTNNRIDYDGIPFNNKYVSKICKKIFDTIDKDYRPDINQWHKQGVLLVPVSPTSTLESTPNRDIWKPWTSYLVNKVCEEHADIPVVMIGTRAHGYAYMIPSKYKKIVDTWPTMNHRNCWLWVNQILKSQNQIEIEW